MICEIVKSILRTSESRAECFAGSLFVILDMVSKGSMKVEPTYSYIMSNPLVPSTEPNRLKYITVRHTHGRRAGIEMGSAE